LPVAVINPPGDQPDRSGQSGGAGQRSNPLSSAARHTVLSVEDARTHLTVNPLKRLRDTKLRPNLDFSRRIVASTYDQFDSVRVRRDRKQSVDVHGLSNVNPLRYMVLWKQFEAVHQ